MKTVEILILRGASPASVGITLDVLDTANRLRKTERRPPAFELRLSGSGAADYRRVARGLASGLQASDIVILPGLGTPSEAEVRERLGMSDASAAARTVRGAVERGGTVAASCSSVFLLAAGGLLTGRRATTSWWLAPVFRRMHPDVRLDTAELVVSDGPITTAGAAMAQLDLVLAVISRHAGASLAAACARYLLLDERRSQSRYMALAFLSAADPAVHGAHRWAHDRLERGFQVADLAAAVGLEPRTFARRLARATGLSPVRFLQRMRVERAVELIETERLSVEEVAHRVGYADPTTLRRCLRREYGCTPSDLRPAGTLDEAP